MDLITCVLEQLQYTCLLGRHGLRNLPRQYGSHDAIYSELLCSHIALNEPIRGDPHITAEQLEMFAHAWAAHKQAYHWSCPFEE